MLSKCNFSFIQNNKQQQTNNKKMTQQVNEQWRTTNQNYGNQTKDLDSSTLRQKFARSTLQELKKNDVKNFILQQQNISQRSRHGLFTQPPNLAVGDQYKDIKPDECTKNITVNPKMKDRVQPELFSRLGSTNIGDPYKDKYKEKQLYEVDKNNLNPHGRAFVPSHNGKKINHSEFQHLPEYAHKSYDTRQEDGKVKTGKRNFSTNPMKKGYGNTTTGHLFGNYPYQSNPYDAEKQHNQRQRLEHKAKIGAPFVGKSHTSSVFTPDYIVHDGANGHLPLDQVMKNQERGKSHPKFGAWRGTNPAKKGYNATFEKFPQYIEEGQKQRESIQHEAPWIHNFNGTSKNFGQTLSKPCPVPSQMVLNDLRRK